MTPAETLLERSEACSAMRSALQQVRKGQGRCVVLAGEAGIGKTSLLRAVAADTGGDWRWLQGSCDPLHTPRPLGPLVDLAHRLPPGLAHALHAGDTYNGLFPALLAWLCRSRPPSALVIEDLHWADEATLDCVRYLGRRLADAGFAIILTLRREPGETPAPLRQTLAALGGAETLHIDLMPLSPPAVAEMAARHGRPAAGLHALTGGNPFYLQQVLASAPGTVPGSLRDSVLDQAAALSPAAREALDLVAVSPGGLELALLLALQPQAAKALDEPAAKALLDVRPPSIGLRHDLARQVIEQALPPLRRWQLHQALLAQLSRMPARPGLLARRVHHAAAAGLSGEVFEMAQAAASEAEAVAAYRSAVKLLQLALEHAGEASPARRAALLDRLALRCHAVQAVDASIAARRQAVDLWKSIGHRLQAATSLAQLALQLTPDPQALPLARQALSDIDSLGTENPEHLAGRALVASALAISLANAGHTGEALTHARRALHCADGSGDVDAQVHAGGIAASVALSLAPSTAAFDRLSRCIDEAIALGRPDRAAVPMVNLASVALAHGDYARVLAVTGRGIAYVAERDLDLVRAHLLVRRALALVEVGRWDEMLATLDTLAAMPALPVKHQGSAAILRSHLDALRGGANDSALWAAHLAASREGRADLVPAFVAIAATQAAWLRGDLRAARELARQGLAEAEGPWALGQLRAWLRRSGGQLAGDRTGTGAGTGADTAADMAARTGAGEHLAPPHRAAEAGDWQQAHDLWLARGCRFDAALALLEGDQAARRQALALLVELGAEPAAHRLRRELSAAGLRGLSRGPYTHVKADPLGLTRREREIAELLVAGLSNAEIALRVHRSARTVAHHVSAVLTKLGLGSRRQVAACLMGSAADPAVQPARRSRASKPSTPSAVSSSDEGSGTEATKL